MNPPTKLPGARESAAIAALLERAVQCHQSGRLSEAARLYGEILKRQPRNPDALHLLGVLAHQQGDQAKALELIGRALKLRPAAPLYRNNYGLVLAALDRNREAIPQFRKALAAAPEYPDAHFNLANALQALERHDDAVAAYEKAVALAPGFAQALNNLGISLSRLDRDADAVSAFRTGLATAPNDADLHRNLSISLQKLGRHDEALASCRNALSLSPESGAAHLALGNVLQSLSRHEDAIASFQRALSLAPGDADALNNLGNSLLALNRVEQAADAYRQAVGAAPENADFHCNLGNALDLARRPEEALQCYRNALSRDPRHAIALSYAAFMQRQICDWAGLDELEAAVADHVRLGRASVPPFSFLSVADDPALQLACAARYLAVGSASASPPAVPRQRPDGGKLKVGYISEMFRRHPLSWLIVELLEQHDRSRFEIHGFSYGRDDGSPIRRRVEAAFDAFHDIRHDSDEEAARRIRAEGIDILVDLNGHTERNRLRILSRRPAPIQAHYLGYPGTLGATFIDYLLVDGFVAPPGEAGNYAEQLVFLPHCYQVNDRMRPIAEAVPARAICGLPEKGFVFCSFNGSWKFTPALFDIWMRLLRDCPGSVLWLLGGNETAERNLRQEAARRDIDPARLVFAPRLDLPDHLARLRLADLFLDTLPVNAHTTASDALWAGLPVLTCAGRGMAARVAGSLLRAIGLPELVTGSLGDYEALARRLAADPDGLSALRVRLAANRATEPLFDTPRFRGHIEAAYEQMWDIAMSGQPPRSFAVAPGE